MITTIILYIWSKIEGEPTFIHVILFILTVFCSLNTDFAILKFIGNLNN